MRAHLRRRCKVLRHKINAVLPMLKHVSVFNTHHTVLPNYPRRFESLTVGNSDI